MQVLKTRETTRLRGILSSSSIALLLLVSSSTPVLTLSRASQSQSPNELLKAAATNGKAAIEALRSYTYYAELTLQTVSEANTITGEYYNFTRISFDPDGSRRETLLENKSTLPKEVFVGTNALNNMTRVYQFMLTPETFETYEINFIGREKIDELNTLVFDVKPRIKLPDPEKSRDRYLKGRVWIDDQDLQVVKVAGEALPEQNAHRTPHFETYFENYDKYWFPSYASADDQVRAGNRRTRVIVKVRFTSYKKTRP